MYLALERPWQGTASTTPAADAGVPIDAAPAPVAKKKRSRRGGGGPASVSREVDDTVVLTEADRRLEWRGDAVAAPPRTFDLGADDNARALDDSEIAQGVAAGSAAVVACIQRAVGEAPLTGEVTLQLLVGGDGRVTKSRLRAPAYLHEHGLTTCGRQAARSMRFAATGAPTVVTAPFYLD
ncbi:MAG: hypothetical protein R3B06_10345 [Kofleriaceae bacterium]